MQRLIVLPDKITAEEFEKFEYHQIPVLEHVAYNQTSREFYILETQTNKAFDTFILKQSTDEPSSTMFADPGTVILKYINPIYVCLHILLPYTDKFIPYDQLPKPWNNLELITSLHQNNPDIIELKKVELDEDDILHTVKLNIDNLLVFLETKLDKIAANRGIIGKYASEPKYSAMQVLKGFVPVEVIKLLADKLNISLVKVKAEKLKTDESENVENEGPEKKKVKVEVKKASRTEKELAKIDKKGMKKITSFFKVVSKKK